MKAREGCEIEGGPAIHPETARRLLCTGRVQTVIEDRAGHVVGLGRVTREPPEWMMRQLKYRDRECTFPGCGARRFTQAHHIVWWERGGATDLDNLVLVCSFHHKLVHEYGWGLKRGGDGSVRWFHPDGTRYRAVPRLLARSLNQNSPYLPPRLDLAGVLVEQLQSQADQRPCPAALASPSARENWAARRVSGGTGSARA